MKRRKLWLGVTDDRLPDDHGQPLPLPRAAVLPGRRRGTGRPRCYTRLELMMILTPEAPGL